MASKQFKLDGNPRIREWTIKGINDDDGGLEVATIVLDVNSEWQGPDDGAEYRYHTYYYLDDMDEDQNGFEGHNFLREAEVHAEHLACTLEEVYAERGLRQRQERAIDLRDLVSDWAFGPERVLVEMIADLIESGQADDLLEESLSEVIEGLGGSNVTSN